MAATHGRSPPPPQLQLRLVMGSVHLSRHRYSLLLLDGIGELIDGIGDSDAAKTLACAPTPPSLARRHSSRILGTRRMLRRSSRRLRSWRCRPHRGGWCETASVGGETAAHPDALPQAARYCPHEVVVDT